MEIECVRPSALAVARMLSVLSASCVLSTAMTETTRAAGACDRSTAHVLEGCRLSSDGALEIDLAKCDHERDPSSRQRCVSKANAENDDATKLCGKQSKARADVCGVVGQAPYDPPIDPANFVKRIDNPLLPMTPGDVRVYKDGDATVTVTVTDRTIELLGVTCMIVRDVNKIGNKIEEDTFDYYAQDRDGNVWYFGEDTISYDKGIASTEGSWRAGLNGARPGIVMSGDPKLGKTFRQEFLLAVAEDLAKTDSKGNEVTVPFGTFSKTLKTLEFTPLEPEVDEAKYYARGVGLVLAVNRVTGEREELVSFERGGAGQTSDESAGLHEADVR